MMQITFNSVYIVRKQGPALLPFGLLAELEVSLGFRRRGNSWEYYAIFHPSRVLIGHYFKLYFLVSWDFSLGVHLDFCLLGCAVIYCQTSYPYGLLFEIWQIILMPYYYFRIHARSFNLHCN